MPKTASPSSTHGEVTALTASERPGWAARPVAICMPCLSMTCPMAAVATANSSSATLSMVKRCLPDVSSWSDRPVSWSSGGCVGRSIDVMAGRASGRTGPPVSDDFDMHRFLGVRGQPENVLVAEQGRPDADQALVDLAGDPESPPVGFGDGAKRQSGDLLFQDVESAGADQSSQGRPGEEAQVRLVQDAPAVLAEQAHGHSRPGVPARELPHR